MIGCHAGDQRRTRRVTAAKRVTRPPHYRYRRGHHALCRPERYRRDHQRQDARLAEIARQLRPRLKPLVLALRQPRLLRRPWIRPGARSVLG
jgi:hypothetical protein